MRKLSAILFPFRGISFPDIYRKGNKSVKLNMYFLNNAVHTKLCAMLHWQMYSLIIPFMMVQLVINDDGIILSTIT